MISCVPSLVSELHLPFARISGVRSLAFRGVGHALSFDMLEEALEDIGFKHLDNCRNHFHYCKSGQTLASTKNTIIVISNQRKIHINTIPYDIRSFVRSVVRSFVRSFLRSFVRSFMHSFIHSFIHFQQSVILCLCWASMDEQSDASRASVAQIGCAVKRSMQNWLPTDERD